MKKWKCTVCGYIHQGETPPESCPICKATADKFTEFQEAAIGKRFRCTVCGHIHVGENAPGACEVCKATAEQFIEIDGGAVEVPVIAQPEEKPAEPVTAAAAPAPAPAAKKPSLFARMIMALHVHPISVHVPNGILPMVLVFLACSVFLKMAKFDSAIYFSLIFVLATMPLVLATGILEWKNRYNGAKTVLFITKICCSGIATLCLLTLVVWRYFVPGVALPDSPNRLLFFIVAAVMVGAVGIAGHLGGHLVFSTRGR